ncbi:MAG: CPBP family intramembrane metalloprotease [Deltaproteobacteria bacterium]|nr:CPBP family intramembrane metalloprotease [Deltaproteobacteria bacterium]
MTSPQPTSIFAKANLLTSLVLVLPLLVFYEIGVLASDQMNGADLITSTLVRMVGVQGLIWTQVGLMVLVVGIAIYLRKNQQLKLKQILPVLIESLIYALMMGTFIIYVMVDLLGIDPRLAAVPLAKAGVFQKLVMSVGAGVHEELIFRLLLLGGLVAVLTKTHMVERTWLAFLIALVISSVLFSAVHHIGPLGDALRVGVFVYRIIAGVLFGLLYQFRGFAVAVYTHAIYDIYVLVIAG